MSQTKEMLWKSNVVSRLNHRILESLNSWGEVCWVMTVYIKQEKSGDEKGCVISLSG